MQHTFEVKHQPLEEYAQEYAQPSPGQRRHSKGEYSTAENPTPLRERLIKLKSSEVQENQQNPNPEQTNIQDIQEEYESVETPSNCTKLEFKGDLESQEPNNRIEKPDSESTNGQSENVEESGRHNQKLQKPKLYAYRWIILVLYLIGDLGPSMMVTTTTPIANQLSKIYDLMPIEINLSSLVILFISPIATIFSSKFLDQKGLGISIRVGIVVCCGGAWLRTLVNKSYYFVVLGNLLTGLGSPFIFNGKTQVASNWFSHEQGPGVTSFITFWTNLNSIAGMMFAGNFLGSYEFNSLNGEEGKSIVFNLMLIIAFIMSGIALVLFFLFRQNPPTPPSFTAQIEREQNFLLSVKQLLRNRTYVFIVIQQGLILGSISGMSTSISYLVGPYGFDSADSTFMLASIPVGGIIGIIIGSHFLQKYKRYKYQMGVYMIGGSGCLFVFLLMLYTGKIYLTIISAGVVGIFFVPLIPTFLEFACESVFPIGEGSAVGFLSAVNSIFALIYGSILSFIVKGESKSQTFEGVMVMLASFGLAFLLLFFTKEHLKRLEKERESCSEFENSKEIQLSKFNFQNQKSIDESNDNSENIVSLQSMSNTDIPCSDLDSPDVVKHKRNIFVSTAPTVQAQAPVTQVVVHSNNIKHIAEPESVFSSTSSTDYSTSDSQFKSNDQPNRVEQQSQMQHEVHEKNFLSTDSEMMQSKSSGYQTSPSKDSPINIKNISDSEKVKHMMQKIYPSLSNLDAETNTSGEIKSNPLSSQKLSNEENQKKKKQNSSSPTLQTGSINNVDQENIEEGEEDEEDGQDSLKINSATDVDVVKKELMKGDNESGNQQNNIDGSPSNNQQF